MRAIADTGPLVAFIDRRERHHGWVVDQLREIETPLLVCEPVLAEAAYMLRHHAPGFDALLALLQTRALRIAFRIDENVGALRQLLQKYRDQPMSLADACLVRMAELHERHAVLTLDADFLVYRKHGRAPLSLIHPAAERS